MGIIVPFVPKVVENQEPDVLTGKIELINSSQFKASLSILPEEITVVLRLLIKENKSVDEMYKESAMHQLQNEMFYWKKIGEIIDGLIKTFKNYNDFDAIIKTLSFNEFDCLVGIMEEYIQEKELDSMILLPDDSYLLTNQIKRLYEKVIPQYEEALARYESELLSSE